ncbi:hypothetical protein SRHO_G00242440 [Serrasalmus rhombeus]
MNIIRSACLGARILCRTDAASSPCSQQHPFSSWALFSGQRTTASKTTGVRISPLPSWQYQQVRTGKRGTEYQPKNIKRKRTHGWIKRISTQSGIEVILRRMLKGRRSLTH